MLLDVPTYFNVNDALKLSDGCRIRFDIECTIGKNLALLVEDMGGWRVHVPGRIHDGIIRSSTEQIITPPFAPPLGPHHFVFLELPGEGLVTSLVDARSLAPEDKSDIRILATALAEPLMEGRWRWGEVFAYVHGHGTSPPDIPVSDLFGA